MDNGLKILFLAVLILTIVFMVYFYNSSEQVVVRQKTLLYDNKKLFTGSEIVFTTNYSDKILYNTTNGLKEYDIVSGTFRNISSIKAIGLAFDKNTGNYIVLDKNGRLFNLKNNGDLKLIDSGYSDLYDTQIGGYYMKSGDDFSYIGARSAKNNGNYGDLKISVK